MNFEDKIVSLKAFSFSIVFSDHIVVFVLYVFQLQKANLEIFIKGQLDCLPEVVAALCPLEDLLVSQDSAPHIEVSHGSMTWPWALNLRVICLKTSMCACAGL